MPHWDEQTAADSRALVEITARRHGHEPRVWKVGTMGFESYHYRYDSGRDGDAQAIGFYPRKGEFTVYLMDGTARYGTPGCWRTSARTRRVVCACISNA